MNTVDGLLGRFYTFSMKTKIKSDYARAISMIFVFSFNLDYLHIFILRMYGNPIGLVSKNKVCFANPNLNLVDANNEKLLPFKGNLCIS